MVRINSFYAIVCLTVVAGCATATDVGLPDGTNGYALNCSGSANGWGACWKKAGEICKGRGYDIVARDQQTGQVTVFTMDQANAFGSSSPVMNREMLVRCK